MYKLLLAVLLLVVSLEANGSCPPKNCGYNAPYRVQTCYDLFFEVDFLYWQGLEEGLSIGASQTEIIDPCFSFDPGVRVLAGTFFSWDNWCFQGEFTRFYQDSKTTKSDPIIFPYWVSTTETFTDTIAKWKLKFDEASIALGRECYLGRCITGKIHIGLEGLWIRQDFIAKYMNSSTNVKSDNNLSMWGLGPRMGWDTKWLFLKNFQIFTEIRGSIVYADFYENDHEVFTNGALTERITSDNDWYLTPILDMSMGFGWGCYYKRCYINLKAGYSARILWNQSRFFKNVQTMYSSNGNLYLQGLTLYFTFYF